MECYKAFSWNSIDVCEEQSFRNNLFTTDGIVRQLIQKSIKYDKSVFICFMQLEQGVGRVKLEQITELVKSWKVCEVIV